MAILPVVHYIPYVYVCMCACIYWYSTAYTRTEDQDALQHPNHILGQLLILPVLLFIAMEERIMHGIHVNYQVRLHLYVVWWVGTIPKISSCELEPDEKMDLR
jgi:hypothetical protein